MVDFSKLNNRKKESPVVGLIGTEYKHDPATDYQPPEDTKDIIMINPQIEKELDDELAALPKPKKYKPKAERTPKITPTFINQFISWVYSLDANDPLYRDQRNLINLCKKEHNHAQIRHVLDLLSIYWEMKD